MLQQKNSRKQGDVGVAMAIAYFASMGCPTFIPLGESQRYDLVIEIEGYLKKIQVKTSRQISRNGQGYDVVLKTCGGNQSWNRVVKKFDPTAVDFLFVFTDDGTRYLIPSNVINATTSITVGNKLYSEYKV